MSRKSKHGPSGLMKQSVGNSYILIFFLLFFNITLAHLDGNHFFFTLRDSFNCWDKFFFSLFLFHRPFVMCCPPSQLMYLYYTVCNTCTRLSYSLSCADKWWLEANWTTFSSEKEKETIEILYSRRLIWIPCLCPSFWVLLPLVSDAAFDLQRK